MKHENLDPETADWLNRIMVPVRHAGVHGMTRDDGQDTLISIVLLDATGRPDLVDLRRVIETEGERIETEPLPSYHSLDPPFTIFVAKVTSPVSCEFAFRLPWKGNEGFFRLLAESGTIYVSPGESIENTLREGLGVRTDKKVTAEVIDLWEAPPDQ